MKILPRKKEPEDYDIAKKLKEGFTYAFNFEPIRSILLLLGLVSLMAMHIVLMPVFAKDIFHGGPHTLGFLMAANGVGALAGAMYLASRKSVLGLGKLIAIASGVFGSGLMAFALSRLLWLSMLIMSFTGFGMIVQMASSNTILQTIADDDKRGRVMSLYAMAFQGMAPIGSLLGGSLASSIGAPNTLLVGGFFCLLGSLMFAKKLPVLRQMVRPTYVRMGIISEVSPETQVVVMQREDYQR